MIYNRELSNSLGKNVFIQLMRDKFKGQDAEVAMPIFDRVFTPIKCLL